MNKPVDRYTYRVTKSEDDSEYFGLCAEFPGLSWLARIPEAGLRGMRRLVAETVAELDDSGEAIPEPPASRFYSGNFIARVPPQLYRLLAIEAAES